MGTTKPQGPREAPLATYRRKRDFAITPEPEAMLGHRSQELSFVVQKHAATRLHYDFRLELDGVLLSWAVPKGPSFDPADKRMAIHVEDHPVSYGSFEGTIPPKQYGAGEVIVWDRGTWTPVGDPRQGMQEGKLVFHLHGEKLAGLWELVRIRKPGDRQDPWLLFKKKDEWARRSADYDVVTALPDSVIAKPLGLLEARRPAAVDQRKAGPPSTVTIAHERLEGAVQAALPARLAPQLATLGKAVPTGSDWLFEIKFDGYRVLIRLENGKGNFITRGGHDWTSKLPSLAQAVEALGVGSAWLDGELVVLKTDGTPDFNGLQNAFDTVRTDSIHCILFDVPYFEGYDLRRVPLQSRRALLEQLLEGRGSERLRFSAAFDADPSRILQSACALGLEGLIAKRKDAPYVSRRTETWLKLKCGERQEFVIGGYTERSGASREIGSLLLGVHDDEGRLVYVGNVGTGWDARSASELHTKLRRLRTDTAPFAGGAPTGRGRWTRRAAVETHWVAPRLLAEIDFTEWTPDGHVRHASFHGLRSDKSASEIKRERAVSPPPQSSHSATKVEAPRAPRQSPALQRISNPDRVIDPTTGLKKLDLVRYYQSVADRILPHLRGRPVSLVRGPGGIAGELFFQKHGDKLAIPGIRELDPALWPGHQALLEIATVEGLVGAAQMNVIEFHTGNWPVRHVGRPDRVVFDLDPGEGVTWTQLQEAAVLTRTILTELGLKSWLKTSGGKGLHIFVPLAPRLDDESVSAFAKAVVAHLARTIPSRFAAKSGAANRKGRIFVDYLRNGYAATTVAAYSARARPGLGVSMPVDWDDLSTLKSGSQWTIATAREHLSFQRVDPWSGYFKSRQRLARAMKVLGLEATTRSRPAEPS